MAGMLLVGLGLVVTRELMRTARGAGRAVDATRPAADRAAPAPVRPAAVASHAPEIAEETSFGGLARALHRRVAAVPGQRTLLFATGGGSDGPAIGLALARLLSEAGCSVVAVDAGTDGTGLAGSAGIEPGPGLREVIAGRASFEDVLKCDRESGVHLIPAGASVLAAKSAGTEAQLRLSLEALSEIYDQVLVVVSSGRLKLLSDSLAGLIDTAVEIADGDGYGTPGSVLSESGVEVMRYRPAHTWMGWPKQAAVGTAPIAAE
jgi:Mrp family chromosome partitioning ATPase